MSRVVLSTSKILIRPRSETQVTYASAIDNYDIVFGIGPAGTGKTYLAVAAAVATLKSKAVSRIILTRPAVEAGESLGYLPGDIQDKVDPYLRPLYDALRDMLPNGQLSEMMELRTLEIAPLAFMRGRTLNNAAIILDEAQNCTVAQMLMFLTRLGHRSKMIVTGDDSQSDLPNGERSGFTDAVGRLKQVDGVTTIRLGGMDIVRHPMVQRVVEAYGREGRGIQQAS